MAVDTLEKRFSMLNFGDGSHSHLTFEPDSSVDLDDRQHLLDCYSGIAFAEEGGGELLQLPRHYLGGFNTSHGGYAT